jgi:1-acyl-sn-glycerol-3-phosphate acyltransferase
MGVENIEKYSRWYALLKSYLRFWHDRIFYKKVMYVHREKVPLNLPLIFTPNHQNALMDALAIEFSFDNQFVFVARSDIFKNKFIASLLYFFKILPVYRIRDGYDSLKKNEMIFRKTLDIIRNKNGFVIFPEGNHAGVRRLRGLKKGFARIAFQAAKAEDFIPDIRVVPVGINYSDYEHFRSELLVIFGEAFPVSPFIDAYKKNPARAYNQIKEKLAGALKPLMVHIESRHYDACRFLMKVYTEKACRQTGLNPEDLYDRFRAGKKVVAALERFESEHPKKMKKLADRVSDYQLLLKEMKLRDIRPVTPLAFATGSLWLVLGFPFFVYGYVNHFFPWNISEMTGRRISDPQFRSSFKFVLSLFSFPLFYLLQSVAVYFVFSSLPVALAYLASLPVSAALSWHYAKHFGRWRQAFRFLARKRKNDPALRQAQHLFSELTVEMENIFERYNG